MEQRGRSFHPLASRSSDGKGRALPEGTEAAVRAKRRLRVRGGGWEKRARARDGGVGGAVESQPPPGRAEMLQPPHPPRSLDPPILPLPALQRICTPPFHPWDPFQDCSERRGRGPLCSLAGDAALPGRKNTQSPRMRSPCASLPPAHFPEETSGAEDASQPMLVGSVWGQKARMMWGLRV